MAQFDSDSFLQCAQDPLAGWDEFEKEQRAEQIRDAARTSATELKSPAKKGRKRNQMEMASYIISKSAIRGRKIIKLQVYDFDSITNSYSETVKLQHVVVDPFLDEVLNLTETLISKVSKKLRED